MADEKSLAETDEKAIEPTDPFGRPIKYISDEERRAKEVSEEEAGSLAVQDATPSSGGVFPPSAVVTPFSPEVVAQHTPGEQKPEEATPGEQKPEETPGEQKPEEATPA